MRTSAKRSRRRHELLHTNRRHTPTSPESVRRWYVDSYSRFACSRTTSNRSHPARSRDRRINRYYDPATGQFLSVDSMVESTGTPYAYAGDNPVMAVDPLGLWWCLPKGVSGACPIGYTRKPPYNMHWLGPSSSFVRPIRTGSTISYELVISDQYSVIYSASGRGGKYLIFTEKSPTACSGMQSSLSKISEGSIIGSTGAILLGIKYHEFGLIGELMGAKNSLSPLGKVFMAAGVGWGFGYGIDSTVTAITCAFGL